FLPFLPFSFYYLCFGATVKPMSIVIRLSGFSFELNFLERVGRAGAETEAPLPDRVISGDLEKSGIGFAANDVGQAVGGFAHERIAVFAQDDGLQFRRIPSFVH